jgi:hypothetical protein
MSIYTKIFATASIFAIAASALISPVANAAEIVVNQSSTGNYTYCLTATAGSAIAPVGYNILDTAANTATIYVVASANANTTTQTCTTVPSAIVLPAMPGHTTSYDLNGSAIVTTSNVKVKNTALTSANVVKSCEGTKTVFTITGTDGDEVNHISNSIPTADYDVTPSGTKPLKITVAKKSGSTSTGVTGAFIYVKEILPTVSATAVAYTVDEVASNVQLVADIAPSCTATVASSSVMASSSMAASSTAATTSSTATSAVAAKSSTTAPEVVVEGPGKGAATVRTGGAY